MAKGKAGPSKVWCFYGVIDTQTNICKWFSHSKNDKIKMRAKHYQFHPISMSFDYSSTFFHDNLMTSKYKYRSLLVLLVLGELQKPRFGPACVRTTENKWKQNIQRSKIWFDAQIIRLLHSNIFKQYSAATASSNFLSLRRHSPAVLPRKDRKPCSPINMAGMPLVPQGTCHVNKNAFELAARTHQRIVIWHLWSIPWASPFLDIKFADVQSSNLPTGAPDRYSSND